MHKKKCDGKEGGHLSKDAHVVAECDLVLVALALVAGPVRGVRPQRVPLAGPSPGAQEAREGVRGGVRGWMDEWRGATGDW